MNDLLPPSQRAPSPESARVTGNSYTDPPGRRQDTGNGPTVTDQEALQSDRDSGNRDAIKDVSMRKFGVDN